MTRVWYEAGSIEIEGLEPFPSRSLVASLSGDRVVVQSLGGMMVMQPLYSEYAKKDGSTFASATAAKAYLDAEFSKYEASQPGPPGATWTIGAGAPTAAANQNDLYLDTSTGDIYRNN